MTVEATAEMTPRYNVRPAAFSLDLRRDDGVVIVVVGVHVHVPGRAEQG